MSNDNSVREYLELLDENAERWMIMFFYTFIVYVIVVGVLRRFVLNFSSQWTTETAIQAYIFLTWIGAAWAVKRRIHIRVNAIFSVVSEKYENVLYILSDLTYIYVGVLTLLWFWPVWQRNLQQASTSVGLNAPWALFMTSLLLGFALFTIRTVQVLYIDVQNLRHGRPAFTGAETLFGD